MHTAQSAHQALLLSQQARNLHNVCELLIPLMATAVLQVELKHPLDHDGGAGIPWVLNYADGIDSLPRHIRVAARQLVRLLDSHRKRFVQQSVQHASAGGGLTE